MAKDEPTIAITQWTAGAENGAAVEQFVVQRWNEAWKEHLGAQGDPHPTFAFDAMDRVGCFIRQRGVALFVAQDTNSNAIIGSIVCHLWRGPVPIEVLGRDVLTIGTIWGFHCCLDDAAETKAIRKRLLQRALHHLRDNVRCHKVVVVALSEAETKTYRECGFEPKNMLTLSLKQEAAPFLMSNPVVDDIHIAGKNGDASPMVRIKKEGSDSDDIVVDHWRKMWLDVGIPEDGIAADMKDVTIDFLKQARDHLQYQTFVARKGDTGGLVVGSVSCQVWDGPIPQVVSSHKLGTIWAVYVHPDFRRQGIATALMKTTLRYLYQIGCDIAILIAASEGGQCVYERVGFAPNNALVLDFVAEESSCTYPTCSAKGESLGKVLAGRLQSVNVLDIPASVVNALVTATTQQLVAVFDGHPLQESIIDTVVQFQLDHNLYIDPKDNWFTQNVKKFGKGFDMKKLNKSETALASKFDRLAEHYDHWTVGNRSKVERFTASCAKQLLRNTNAAGSGSLCVLDVACGIGLQGQTLRMCGFDGCLVGNDVSPGMIACLTERGCYDHAFIANANKGFDETDTYAARKFDVVICTGAMELLDHAAAIRNISAVLKPGGEAWLSFQHDSEEAGAPKESTQHQNVGGIKKIKVDELLLDAGLHVVSCETCPDAFYTPSSEQDGSLLPVPYLFVVANKLDS